MSLSPRQVLYFVAALGMLASLVAPLSSETADAMLVRPAVAAAIVIAAALYVLAAFLNRSAAIAATFTGVLLGCWATLHLLNDPAVAGTALWGFWLPVLANWIAAWLGVAGLADLKLADKTLARAVNLAIPLVFGAFIFYLWEVTVRGFGVPSVLFPAPSAIAVRFAASLQILWEDFFQTFILGVVTGYVIGCGAGFLTAVIAHRYTFLGRGLLPLGNFVSALPIVGIAPIMVMWFGFDWQSKAAVVVVITFFPMLVNTLAGLNASGHIERDLMRSYAADHRQNLQKLYLPAAMPFIFNALKINSTLAFIGAIVAEFFGTPTQGIGFRISIMAGRMALDTVWAEIALAALAGMAFYGLVALAERATTFWHPSYRT
ncbi:MAG TPA: ABC transporter permease [Xanthobacteraceae bacterium]|jgi:NitT/TauT family transport system permease protein|nr:ABC transporter permease [Xanthobacteraceae bacterium]